MQSCVLIAPPVRWRRVKRLLVPLKLCTRLMAGISGKGSISLLEVFLGKDFCVSGQAIFSLDHHHHGTAADER